MQSQAQPQPEVSNFPSIVNVEVLRGVCPCRCVHCPVGLVPPSKRLDRFGDGSIDLPLFEKICREIACHPDSALRVHAVGEPLVWPSLAEAASIIARTGVRSWLFTCGITKDLALLEKICDAFEIIEFSVNSCDAADYRRSKGVDRFDRVVSNIADCREHVDSQGLATRLLASRVETLDTAKDDRFVKHWKGSGLVDDAFVRSYHSYNNLLENRIQCEQRSPCRVHWTRFNISHEGKVIICFNELFRPSTAATLILGDIHRDSIHAIWHGQTFTALRENEWIGANTNNPTWSIIPCSRCTYPQPLSTTQQTSEHQLENNNA